MNYLTVGVIAQSEDLSFVYLESTLLSWIEDHGPIAKLVTREDSLALRKAGGRESGDSLGESGDSLGESGDSLGESGDSLAESGDSLAESGNIPLSKLVSRFASQNNIDSGVFAPAPEYGSMIEYVGRLLVVCNCDHVICYVEKEMAPELARMIESCGVPVTVIRTS